MEKEIIENCITKLDEVAEVLYKNDVNMGLAKMNLVIPYIAMISTEITDEEVQGRLVNDVLTPALEAMESKDATLLADIITYELKPILEGFL